MVDLHMHKGLFWLGIFACLLDLFTTIYLLNVPGLIEGNPLARLAMQYLGVVGGLYSLKFLYFFSMFSLIEMVYEWSNNIGYEELRVLHNWGFLIIVVLWGFGGVHNVENILIVHGVLPF